MTLLPERSVLGRVNGACPGRWIEGSVPETD